MRGAVWQACLAYSYVLLWIALSASVILYNKWILVYYGALLNRSATQHATRPPDFPTSRDRHFAGSSCIWSVAITPALSSDSWCTVRVHRVWLPGDADNVAHVLLLLPGGGPHQAGLCRAARWHDLQGAPHLCLARTMLHVVERCALHAGGHQCEGHRLVPHACQQVYCQAILPIGATYAIVLWLGNAAYLYLSVSFIQMIKVSPGACTSACSRTVLCLFATAAAGQQYIQRSLSDCTFPNVLNSGTDMALAESATAQALAPVTVFAVGSLVGTETYSHRVMANMLVVTAGVAIASYGELNLVWIGFFMQLAAILLEACRLILVQARLQPAPVLATPADCLQLLTFLNPSRTCAWVCSALLYSAARFKTPQGCVDQPVCPIKRTHTAA